MKASITLAILTLGLLTMACNGDGGSTEPDTEPTATEAPTAEPTVAVPTDTPEPATATVPPPTETTCSPYYLGVCIPPFPPDLDCGEISERRFTVLPPDPHGFDGDNDGVGCESG